MRARHVFALTSLVFLGVLAISPAKNALRPYRSLQQQFRRLGETRAHSLKEALRYERRISDLQIRINMQSLTDGHGYTDSEKTHPSPKLR